MPENCLFCLEAVGPSDLAVPNLPCMCRTPQHDTCRAEWNRMNPYRCPICRKTYKPETGPAPSAPVSVSMYTDFQLRNGPDPIFIVQSLDRSRPQIQPQPQTYQEPVYITMPPSPPAQVSRPNFQTPMTPEERRRYACNAGVKAIVCLGIMFIILLIILMKDGV